MLLTTANAAKLFAVAMAVGAVGALTAPIPAQAADTDCTFARDAIAVLRNDGTMLVVDTQPGGKKVGPNAILYTTQDNPQNTDVLARGSASGAMPADGAIVEFTFTSNGRQPERYFGVLTYKGAALGTDGIGWSTPDRSVTCTSPSGSGGAKTATVLQATDIYNAPNGTGQPYKDANGANRFKPPGQVQLVAPELCNTATNWCHVVAPEVPGKAYIYIGDGLGTYP